MICLPGIPQLLLPFHTNNAPYDYLNLPELLDGDTSKLTFDLSAEDARGSEGVVSEIVEMFRACGVVALEGLINETFADSLHSHLRSTLEPFLESRHRIRETLKHIMMAHGNLRWAPLTSLRQPHPSIHPSIHAPSIGFNPPIQLIRTPGPGVGESVWCGISDSLLTDCVCVHLLPRRRLWNNNETFRSEFLFDTGRVYRERDDGRIDLTLPWTHPFNSYDTLLPNPVHAIASRLLGSRYELKSSHAIYALPFTQGTPPLTLYCWIDSVYEYGQKNAWGDCHVS